MATSDFQQKFITFSPKDAGTKKVLQIEIQLLVQDSTGTVHLTDVMFQGGPVPSIWTGHPSEMRWSNDF